MAVLFVAACGARAATTTTPAPMTPADDLARAKIDAPKADPGSAQLDAKDPRVVDLDIIRIRASGTGVGGEPDLTSVATADLFRAANEAAKAGQDKDAIARYRQLVSEFPDSQYAPVSLFNIAAIYDRQADMSSTITTLRELVTSYPQSRESVEGHLFIAALHADRKQWNEAAVTLGEVLGRPNLTFADRIEANARKGYVELEQRSYDAAERSLEAAVAEWRRAPRIEDPYYIAMAHYYRGELYHRRFTETPVRFPDDQMVADLEAKRVLAVKAYDLWKESLGFKHAYWATAAGYQMSQIFVELWEAHVKAPYPTRIEVAGRPKYVEEVHDRVREHLTKALEGHRMNVELAKAFGVDTAWSKGSEQRAVQIMDVIAKESTGAYVTPDHPMPATAPAPRTSKP
ncbi:MAG: tol-pal system YbgF family protein [Kofleriaceae bacterium]